MDIYNETGDVSPKERIHNPIIDNIYIHMDVYTHMYVYILKKE